MAKQKAPLLKQGFLNYRTLSVISRIARRRWLSSAFDF